MEQESNMQAPPALCRANCGFYGNPATDGMCSVCFKEALKKKQQPPASSSTSSAGRSSPVAAPQTSPSSSNLTVTTALPTMPVLSPKSDTLAMSASSSASDLESQDGSNSAPASASASEDGDGEAGKKKPKNRCHTCRKKVGLTGFECRCGGMFCSVHRYSDKHDCSFNYRELGAEEIRRNNPVVVGQKIQKI